MCPSFSTADDIETSAVRAQRWTEWEIMKHFSASELEMIPALRWKWFRSPLRWFCLSVILPYLRLHKARLLQMNFILTFIWKKIFPGSNPYSAKLAEPGFEPGTFWLLDRRLSSMSYLDMVRKSWINKFIYITKSPNWQKNLCVATPQWRRHAKVTRRISLTLWIWLIWIY